MLNKKLLYLLSFFFIAAVGMRFNFSLLAWVVYVPLLLLARMTDGKKGWFALLVLLELAYFAQIAKIVTDPMPLLMALAFSAPMAFGAWVLLWLFEKARRVLGDVWGAFLFASLMSLSEWASFYSELGTWGSMTYTQLGNLPFLQLSSLFGITFSSFFIYLSSAFVAAMIANSDRAKLIKPATSSFVLFMLLYGYGVWRVESGVQKGEHVTVAAIAGDMKIDTADISNNAYLKEKQEALLQKTQRAIEQGAKLIGWSEGAAVIHKEDETKFIEQIRRLSLEHEVQLFVAYIVPLDGLKRFENKYLFVDNGEIVDSYLKMHLVPGEPALKGERHAKVFDVGYATLSGAICYDFDFPTLGRRLSQQQVDIAVVPSNDWRGIDPIHGYQAMVRAIEGGYALLRPVQGATSFAFDAYGRVRASMSYFEENERVMLASLPTQRVWTLYGVVGDLFALGLLLFVGYMLFKLRNRVNKISI